MAKKLTAKERGYSKNKSNRKQMKQEDAQAKKVGKGALSRGKQDPTGSTSKSRSSSSSTKTPVKRSTAVRSGGGFRGGIGGGMFGIKNR